MKVLYSILAVLIVILMQICMQFAKRKEGITSKILITLHLSVLHGLSNYTFFLWLPNYTASSIFYSLYSINIPWMLGTVGALAVSLVGYKSDKAFLKKLIIVSIVLYAMDIVLMLGNVPFRWDFSMAQLSTSGGAKFWMPQFRTGYWIHLGYCYFLVLAVSIILIVTTRKSAKLYRKRYVSTIIALFMCVILNAVCMYTKQPVDFSIIVYGLISALANFMTLKAIPNALVNNMMSIVSENINSGIACFDMYGKCAYLNRTARLIFKVKNNGILAAEEYRKNIRAQRNSKLNLFSFEDYFMLNDENHTFTVEYKDFIDKKGRIIGSYLKFDDRTYELRRLENEVYNGSHDLLTGLYNRRAFFEKASEILRNNPYESFYLVTTDIENFKLINDLFGTDIGDKILLAQAKMISFAKYENCIQGHISGDHFAMLIPKKYFNQRMAIINTKKIQNSIPEIKYKLHMYLGVYEVESHEEPVQSMVDKALLAIDSIHGDYELTLAFYDSNVMARQKYEKTIINSFDDSLEENRFIFFLQPFIAAETGKVNGAEALCRWNHPDFGLLEPESYLQILEKSDAIFKMDNFIWRSACEKLAEWKENGREDIYISVNICSKDFYFGDLYKILTSLVEEYKIKPENLKLEITESVIMKDVKFHKKIIEQLRSYGFQIEMDDFGSGYSSLSALKDIPMDVLKMDLGFLSKSEDYEKKISIIRLIIKMAKQLKMEVVAEGVETEKQAEMLKDLGCDIFQGFFFAKPMAVNAFELKFMRRNSK